MIGETRCNLVMSKCQFLPVFLCDKCLHYCFDDISPQSSHVNDAAIVGFLYEAIFPIPV